MPLRGKNSMGVHIFVGCTSKLWYIQFIESVSRRPRQILSPHLDSRLTQVASLASRHELCSCRLFFTALGRQNKTL